MTKLISTVHFLTFLLLSSMAIAGSKIAELEFAESNMQDVVRTLSELSSSNIIATPEAAEVKVTIHLKNVTVLGAIKSISRVSGLWYRHDEDTNTYRIMTREEYGKDLIVRESEHIEVFHLLNANVQIIAQSIQDLYGGRVKLSLGVEPGKKTASSSNNSSSVSNRRSGNSRSNRSSQASGGQAISGTQIQIDDLSTDQIEQLSNQFNGNTTIDTQALQQITTQAQPIYITVNNEHNMIVVRTDDRKIIKSIASLIKKMDIPIPQVMLEMKILSITLGEDFNSIFNFQLKPSGGNQTSKPILFGNNSLLNSGSLIYEFLNSRLKANIEFLEQNKRIKVLSNPMILASNHRQAELFIGEEKLLTRGFSFNPAVIANGVVVSSAFIETETELQEVGITLRITPRINGDNTVSLELEQESSTIKPGGSTLPVPNGTGQILNFPIDTVDTARLTGTVSAQNGLTIAVGGLIRTSKSTDQKKVPILGDIPVLGRIFRTDIESETDTETVLLITPHIIYSPEESENLRQADNQFYQSYNDGFPDLAPFPNKFIDKETSISSNEQSINNRQNTYLEMSQYAADTIRIAEIERKLDPNYSSSKVSRQAVLGLFDNAKIKAMPQASWNRGGLYVTAVELVNKSNTALPIDYKSIKGQWLASSVESSLLARRGQNDDATFMYLISVLPFDQTIAGIQ